MTTISWRRAGTDEEIRNDEIDLDRARLITYDGGDIAASVAKILYEKNMKLVEGWDSYEGGDGPVLDIIAPQSLSGRFAVSVSKRERKGVMVTGTLARRATVMTEEQERDHFARIAEFTPPETVETAYEILGNRYGHEILGARSADEGAEVSALESAYSNGKLHDLGWPVRCKTSNRIGFLADTTFWDGEPLPKEATLKRFRDETGCVAQPVSRWQGKDVSFLVAFVPAREGTDKAAAVAETLSGLVRPDPAVTLGR